MPSATILVVEDDASAQDLFQVLLDIDGCEVVRATDGDEALERARVLGPQLVLLDLMMPNLDGEEVLKQMKMDSRFARIPVIVVTGKTEAVERMEEQLGKENVFAKPFESTKLLDRVIELIGLEIVPRSAH